METLSKKQKKTGRPVQAAKKEIRAAIRFSKSEYFVIRQNAAKAGIKTSAYIRQAALSSKVKTRLNEEERHFVRQLIGMSNNLNQLAKNSYKEGMLKAMLYFETYRNQIDLLIKSLHHD